MHKSQKLMIERADALYAKRSEIENVRLSVELLKDNAPISYEAAWRMGRAQFFLGQEATTDSETRAYHGQGIRASARAVKLSPLRVEGHFWLGVNLALMTQSKKGLSALFLVWLTKRSLRRAIRIDSSYHGAGPLRVLARIQHKLPRVLGGGHERARVNYESAIQLAPENTVTRIYFAELLLEDLEVVEARKHLEAILSTHSDPAWKFETKRDQNLARELLTRMDKLTTDSSSQITEAMLK